MTETRLNSRDEYNHLPVYSGVLISLIGFAIGAVGTFTMVFYQVDVGMFVVGFGWMAILLGQIMDNTGFLIDCTR